VDLVSPRRRPMLVFLLLGLVSLFADAVYEGGSLSAVRTLPRSKLQRWGQL